MAFFEHLNALLAKYLPSDTAQGLPMEASCNRCGRFAPFGEPKTVHTRFGYQHGGTANDDIGTTWFAWCPACASTVCAQDAGFPSGAVSEAEIFPPSTPLPCPTCGTALFLHGVPHGPFPVAVASWREFLAAPYAQQPQARQTANTALSRYRPLQRLSFTAGLQPLRIGELAVLTLVLQPPGGKPCRLEAWFAPYPAPLAWITVLDTDGQPLTAFSLVPEAACLNSLALALSDDPYWATARFGLGISGDGLLVVRFPDAPDIVLESRRTSLPPAEMPRIVAGTQPHPQRLPVQAEQKERLHAAHYLRLLTEARVWDYMTVRVPEPGRERPRAQLILEGSTDLTYYVLSRLVFKGVRYHTFQKDEFLNHPVFRLCSPAEEAHLRMIAPFGDKSFAVCIETGSFSPFSANEYVVCDRLFGEVAEPGKVL